MLNIVLVVFDRVFLLDPGLKSAFAQKRSCRFFLPLQFLFCPNFKLLYENLSFGQSNASQNQSKGITVPPCSSLCRRDAHTSDCRRRRASSMCRRAGDPRPPRTPFLSVRGRWKLPVPSFPFPSSSSREQSASPSPAPVKRPLIREDLNVIQNISPRRLMPHLLHQMVQNRTNLGGHSIQMITRINQATTIHQSATNTGSNSGSECCDSGGILTGPTPQARLGVER